MTFDPEFHHRRSIRLREYDYSRAGAYFMTVCAFQKECLFGEVVDGRMVLNEMGNAVTECWRSIPDHFPHVELDEFVIMPNHVHGIIVFNDPNSSVGGAVGAVGAQHAAPMTELRGSKTRAQHAAPLRERDDLPIRNVAPGSLGAIIRSFKSAATKRINILRNTPGVPIWQRNYFERVIRVDRELDAVRRYIVDNPAKWNEDENHPGRFNNGTD
jgi:REP element-mobilizing transposase RayT